MIIHLYPWTSVRIMTNSEPNNILCNKGVNRDVLKIDLNVRVGSNESIFTKVMGKQISNSITTDRV